MRTVMPRYIMATLSIMAGVGVLAVITGTLTAWLVVMYRFPLSRFLEYALLCPLAVPAYISAYALVDFFDYSGAFQIALRQIMGWQSAADYYFPLVRSQGMAIVILAGALYPYVYLLARAAFREQSGGPYEIARTLGTGPWRMFWRVGLPLARPAIMAGLALVLMETVADYGTMTHFGIQTLTTGLFDTWLTTGNAGGAAQIALAALGFVMMLITLERIGRRKARFYGSGRRIKPLKPHDLRKGPAFMASIVCFIPFAMGFALPVAIMMKHALRRPEIWLDPELITAFYNTLQVGISAAFLTVSAAFLLVYGMRIAGQRLPLWVSSLTALGYAMPGAVLALGLLLPLAALDHRIADLVLALTGTDPGLLLTGTSGALIIAYCLRFFAVAQGAVEAAFGRISPNLPYAARTLGKPTRIILWRIYLPMMRGSVLMALLIVFVDCVKELPATLLLRPFNFNTLATRVFELSSLEKLEEASPAALIVILVGLLAVMLMAHLQLRKS